MRSRLYSGSVMHERKRPIVNRFRYGVYYLFVDLDEVDDLDASLKRFGHNHRALVSLYDSDHGPRDGSALKPWMLRLLSTAGIDLGDEGRVMLLAFPRVLGFKFYPVAFWYCFRADGELLAILAEVQNTFGEHHNYLLHANGEPMSWRDRPSVEKVLYVSPLIEVEDGRYEFRFTEPGEKLHVAIYDFIGGPLLMIASLDLEERPFTDSEVARLVRRFGPMSLRAVVLIHLQALKIWLRGVKYVPKPPPPKEETSL